MKAVLVGSGTRMTLFNGGQGYDVPLGNPPDYMQGFGRIMLGTMLPLRTVNGFDLFVEDGRAVGENSQVSYALQLPDSATPIKATLAWYDPPGVDGSTAKALLQDLDLRLVGPDGQTRWANGGGGPDDLNTVEHIEVELARPRHLAGVFVICVLHHCPAVTSLSVQVLVSAQALPVTGSQTFALVITSGGVVLYSS